jgi:flagellar biosynthesis protein FlhA
MDAANKKTSSVILELLKQGAGAPVFVLVILAMLTVPLPPAVLDVLFTFNIMLSLLVLMICIYARRPLDFSIFPTVILFATLLRLGLNVASTRVILIHGHSGPGSAGHVIESFGQFVIGGNYVVGMVVFTVLVIINFIVITKGAERVSEVNARFTLDSLPGKQMAIDADLNSGFIDQAGAALRRREIAIEAEFHGSMDGASKFVKGDAVAGIAILMVNLIGGFAIGILQHGLSLSDALKFYTSLSIGDGLAAQIPSLILATATAVIITRVNHSDNLLSLVSEQMFSNPKILFVASGVMTCIGVIPGMPNVVFLSLAAIAGGFAYSLRKKQLKKQKIDSTSTPGIKTQKKLDITADDIKQPNTISLEIGYRLINLITPQDKSELLAQIRGIRKELSQSMGFLIQPLYIADNMDIKPNQYQIKIKGNTVAEGEVMADLWLALNVNGSSTKIPGVETKDPAFGIDATWIRATQKQEAEDAGYSVVDSSTVVATHLRQTLIENAHMLLSHNDVYSLIETMKQKSPRLIDEFYPKHISLSEIMRIFKNLLAENVSLRNLTTICETMAEFAPKELSTSDLTQLIRKALGSAILQNIVGGSKTIEVFTLEPELESILQQGLQQNHFTIEPKLAQKIYQHLQEKTQNQVAQGEAAILLTSPRLRSHLASFILSHIKELHILSYDEIPANINISVKEQITCS